MNNVSKILSVALLGLAINLSASTPPAFNPYEVADSILVQWFYPGTHSDYSNNQRLEPREALEQGKAFIKYNSNNSYTNFLTIKSKLQNRIARCKYYDEVRKIVLEVAYDYIKEQTHNRAKIDLDLKDLDLKNVEEQIKDGLEKIRNNLGTGSLKGYIGDALTIKIKTMAVRTVKAFLICSLCGAHIAKDETALLACQANQCTTYCSNCRHNVR